MSTIQQEKSQPSLLVEDDQPVQPSADLQGRLDVNDPQAIIERIEMHAGCSDDNPYWVRVDALMADAMRDGFDEGDDARHLQQTTGGRFLEVAARHVGFVLGVEYCKKLIQDGGLH